MYLLALLCAEWAKAKNSVLSLQKFRMLVPTFLNNIPSRLESFIGDYKKLEAGVVLGREYFTLIALEGALKILETNCIKMRGYPISDFHHGPLAQIGKGDLVILLAAKGPVFSDSEEILSELDKIGADTMIITDSAEFAGERRNAVVVPSFGTEYRIAVCYGCCFTAYCAQAHGSPRNRSRRVKGS